MKKTLLARFKIRIQGGPVVNSAAFYRKESRIVLIEVDLKSKYCRVGYTVTGNLPAVGIFETPRSVNLDSSKIGGYTEIVFPDFKDWNIYLANCSRYTLHVCLVKPRKV